VPRFKQRNEATDDGDDYIINFFITLLANSKPPTTGKHHQM
jgi:predicted SnoaL-like aldol condensation-catalyzing enzyme